LWPFLSKLFYAVLITPLQPAQSSDRRQPTVFREESTYARTILAISWIDRVVPGVVKRLSRWMYKNNRFAWAPIDIDLIAFGSGAAVFKLSWKDGEKVLRIYRKSLGKARRGLLEIANYYKQNYELVHDWYGAVPDFVLPMDFVVLQGLPLIGPVAASLQPYVHGSKKDLFEDFSDDELLELLTENERVREAFFHFVEQTIHQWDGRKMCYDFIGRENLMLVQQDGEYRLHIVDVGIFKFDTPMNNSTEKIAQIDQRLQRLTSLYERAMKLNQPPAITSPLE
jgi:hypothetical protein